MNELDLHSDVQEGDELSARHWNALRADAKRFGLGPQTHVDSLGARHCELPGVGGGLRLYELPPGILTYPGDTNQPPYAENCAWLRYNPTSGYYEGGDTPVTETLYFPLALLDSEDAYAGLPWMDGGEKVWAAKIGGTWHVVSWQQQQAWRGKLDGSLSAEVDNSATSFAVVSIWNYDSDGGDADTGVNVTAWDWYLAADESLDAGTKVKVEWFPDDGRFYVTAAACGI